MEQFDSKDMDKTPSKKITPKSSSTTHKKERYRKRFMFLNLVISTSNNFTNMWNQLWDFLISVIRIEENSDSVWGPRLK